MPRWRRCREGFLDGGSDGFQLVPLSKQKSLSPHPPISRPRTTKPISNIIEDLTFEHHLLCPIKNAIILQGTIEQTDQAEDLAATDPAIHWSNNTQSAESDTPTPTPDEKLALLSAHDRKTLQGKNPQTCSEPFTCRTKRTHANTAGKSIHVFTTHRELHPKPSLIEDSSKRRLF